MPSILTASDLAEAEQRLVLSGIEWGQYVTIADALPDRRGVRTVYLDGSLTVLTLSRRHDRYADLLDKIVMTVTQECGIRYEVSGSATLRLEELGAGVEPDRAYYFGANAARMGGFEDIDLARQPPPDLTIEVEVTHAADRAMATYARIGVPEVWRLDVPRNAIGFWALEGGAYVLTERSRHLPMLGPADVLAQMERARTMGAFSDWLAQLPGWVQAELVPRLDGGERRP